MLSKNYTSSLKSSAIPLAEILFWEGLSPAAGAKVEPLPLHHCKCLYWTRQSCSCCPGADIANIQASYILFYINFENKL